MIDIISLNSLTEVFVWSGTQGVECPWVCRRAVKLLTNSTVIVRFIKESVSAMELSEILYNKAEYIETVCWGLLHLCERRLQIDSLWVSECVS